jgi:hypothetical protein
LSALEFVACGGVRLAQIVGTVVRQCVWLEPRPHTLHEVRCCTSNLRPPLWTALFDSVLMAGYAAVAARVRCGHRNHHVLSHLTRLPASFPQRCKQFLWITGVVDMCGRRPFDLHPSMCPRCPLPLASHSRSVRLPSGSHAGAHGLLRQKAVAQRIPDWHQHFLLKVHSDDRADKVERIRRHRRDNVQRQAEARRRPKSVSRTERASVSESNRC